ncbi:hypothetical protein D3C85_1087600 [compost metagenome]
MIFLLLQPLDFIPEDPAIASGKLEMKTATNIVRFPETPSKSPKPMIMDSGTPSRIIANTIGIIKLEFLLCPNFIGLLVPKLAISLSEK